MEHVKTKLAVFWLFVAVAMSANTILYFVVLGMIDEISIDRWVTRRGRHLHAGGI